MKRSGIAKKAGLAGKVGLVTLLCLNSPQDSEAEDARFSGSLSGGVYVPPNEEIGLGGIPIGGSFEIDYGNSNLGLVSGAGFYQKSGFDRKTRDSRGRVRESDDENFRAIRINGGGRIGNSVSNLSGGWTLVEDGDRFETKRRKGVFGRMETTSFPSSEVWHGPYLQFKIGGGSDRGYGAFIKGGVDYLLRRSNEPIYTIRFELGINLEIPEK